MRLPPEDRPAWIADASTHLQERAAERRQRRAAWIATGADPAADPDRTSRFPDEPIARQLERRRSAAARLEPLPHDPRRDPHRPVRDDEPAGVGELDACARAQAYLRSCGLTGLPSASIRRAWAALPERYGSVLPRWPAA
jgi:hypothetical protein